MRFLCFLVLAITNVFASNLLTYNIYERSDRIDVMLSFDAPYEGAIYQKKNQNSISLTLNDLIFDQVVEKNINSQIVQELVIEPSKNSTIVTLRGADSVGVVASKTVDGFGLRIRSRLVSPQQTPVKTANQTPIKNNIQTQAPILQDSLIDTRYITVMAVLSILVLFLLWLKYKVTKTTKKSGKVPANWLFKNVTANDMMNVLYQKPLDNQNKVVLFDFQGKQYLVMTGNSNVLLDKLGEGSVQNEGDFQNVFEQNRKRLDEYLKIQQSPLEDYKEKASQDFYPQESFKG